MHDRIEDLSRGALFERLLADAFRDGGWKVDKKPHPGLDLVAYNGRHVYLAEVKTASEGRRDRLVPLLAQALLQAQSAARHWHKPARPLAVVAAPHVSPRVVEEIKRFAAAYAAESSVGVMDLDGLRCFVGSGLDSLNSPQSSEMRRPPVHIRRSTPHLFSDLNQWMLKVLLAPKLPERLLSAPRGEYRNASQLAQAARVSVMSAFRFVTHLQEQGFLEESTGVLRIVRTEELMRRWEAERPAQAREFPARWLIRGGDKSRLIAGLRSYAANQSHSLARARIRLKAPRICLALFSAADALGISFVHGAPTHIYIEKPDVSALQKLGLSTEGVDRHSDVFVRIPAARESVFRAAVQPDGIPASDIVQVWLDVASHPARGRAQAEQIRRRLLAPLFTE